MLPNKVVSIKKSILWKLPDVVECIKDNNNLVEAYYSIEKKLEDINEFLFCIDILYLLDMIEIDDKKGNYRYVKRN